MSRNKNRLSAPVMPPTPHLAVRKNENPFGISFVVPTEEVEIPSQGNFYPETSPMRGKTKLEIRQMTAKEEDLLTNVEFLRNGTLIERLLDSILVDENIRAKDLLDGDKNALVLAARSSAYGNVYEVHGTCPSCDKKIIWNYDLDKKSAKNIDLSEMGVNCDESTGLLTFELPKSGLVATIKLVTPEDRRSIEKTQEKHERLNLEFNETIAFIKYILVDVGGITDLNLLSQLVEVLSPLDARKIKIVHNRALPDVETEQDLTCTECGETCRKEVPFSEGFFWPEL